MQRASTRTDHPALQTGLAICLGLALLVLSYIRIYGDAGSAAFGDKIIDAALAGPVWGTALGNHLLAFAVTQILLHTAFGLACLGMARLSRLAWPQGDHSVLKWLLLWFALSSGWLLVANAALFHGSSLGRPYADLVDVSWHGLSLFSVYSVLLAGALVCTLGKAGLHVARAHSAKTPRWLVPAGAAVVALAVVALRFPVADSNATAQRPHIILIGLDSLRADAVRASPVSKTPAIDEFLQGAVNFSNATTPLARTFPSWVSIITGRHPHTTGAVINLLPRERIDTGETLPQLLSTVGYRSVYAIDEVRFSNLDTSYGFDEMIAPPIGAADFLLGFFADAPLSNLLVNTRVGAVLFPYAHANRAAATTYDPDTFVERLDRNLVFDRPTLLAAHFTLAHWPYSWADSPTRPEGPIQDARELYDDAITRLDRQFGDFMEVLERHGALDNAVVVVLSDHGESLGNILLESQRAGDKPLTDIPEHDESVLQGHGTSVFSPYQYHVVLAVRSYGRTPLSRTEARTIDAAVSLEDVTPTLAAAFGASPSRSFDGTSLLPLLQLDGSAVPSLDQRIRFTETEFNPPGFLPGQLTSTSAMLKAAAYYRVDPVTDRVLIRDERLGEVLAKRQYAAFRKDKLVALVPPAAGALQPDARLVFVRAGEEPTLLEGDPSKAADPDVAELAAALAARFPSAAPAAERQ